jgi:hypothetical protein
MRVRITQQLDGGIDGIQLDAFVPGQIYEVGTSLGSYLLSIQAAEPVRDDEPPSTLTFEQRLLRIGPPRVLATVNDRERRRKKPRS